MNRPPKVSKKLSILSRILGLRLGKGKLPAFPSVVKPDPQHIQNFYIERARAKRARRAVARNSKYAISNIPAT